MKKREAAIVSAYTGYLIGDVNTFHKYVEEKIGRPVFTHEMASKEFMETLQSKSKKDFIEMVIV